MIHQEILKGLKLSVGNGGMSLNLELKAERNFPIDDKVRFGDHLSPERRAEVFTAVITKRDGGVFLNGVLVPFMSANDWPEGEATPEQVRGLIRRSTRVLELKKGDAAYAYR